MNVIRICCALAPIMEPASAIAVCVNPAGQVAVATVPRRRILVSLRTVMRSVPATAPVSAVCANARSPMMVATRVNTVTSAPLARVVAMSSRIACNAKCTARAN